jgi:hypothetical protein
MAAGKPLLHSIAIHIKTGSPQEAQPRPKHRIGQLPMPPPNNGWANQKCQDRFQIIQALRLATLFGEQGVAALKPGKLSEKVAVNRSSAGRDE